VSNIQSEITYYNSLPYVFDGFVCDDALATLQDGGFKLVCVRKNDVIPEKKWVPSYDFVMEADGQKVGNCNIRIGYTENLYYGGHIGYWVDDGHKGNGYAGLACKLMFRVAKMHKMDKLIITNNIENLASARVCEKLGLRFIRVVDVPDWHDLYKEGSRKLNIFEYCL